VVITLSSRVEVDDVGKGVPELGCRFEWYSSSPQLWSMVKLRVGLLVGEVHAEPLSHAVTALSRRHWWRRYRVLLAMARCHYWIMLTMTLPSRWWLWCCLSRHWPWCNVTVESYWWWYYREDIGREAAELTLAMTWVAAESYRRWNVYMQDKQVNAWVIMHTCKINKLMHGWSCTLAR
jgi:hypothetical protein